MQQQQKGEGAAGGEGGGTSRGGGQRGSGEGSPGTARATGGGSQTSSEEFESEEQDFSDMTATSELDDEEDEEEQRKSAMAEQAAELLYGLVHARFLATARGLQLLQQKYAQKQFGMCPNSSCEGWALLPTALTDSPNKHTAKVFCAKCCELYHPPKGSRLNHLDGAYWGTSIAQIFYMQFPFLLPPPRAPNSYYIPTVYGFKVSPQVKTRLRLQQMPRMIQQAKQRAEGEREALRGSSATAGERTVLTAGVPQSASALAEGGGGSIAGEEESRRREMF
ncbi:ck2 beta subunit [Cystoisospora suis]|uniref:Casein kinase II subunit beta n=1 Tax=Cystoisospora suis TaxID=483139 RepID=A0A2C6KP45_9APIC|nr:ck2 beta subunit [Cystoisospora suis]